MRLSVQVLIEVLITFTLFIYLVGVLMTMPVTHCVWKQHDTWREGKSPAFQKRLKRVHSVIALR